MARVTLNQAAGFNADRQGSKDILAICAHIEDLTQVIQAGKRRGFEFIWLSELANAVSGKGELPEHPAVLVCDDGRIGMFQTLYPSVLAQNVKANMMLTSNFIYHGLDLAYVDNSLVSVGQQPMTWANARTMRDSGLIEFHNHSKTHNVTNTATIDDEIASCNAAIVTELGVPSPIACAYPNGNATTFAMQSLIAHGIKIGFDFQPSTNSGSDRFSTLEEGLYTLNRITTLDWSAFKWVLQRSFVAYENDLPHARNYNNALNFWTMSSPGSATAYQGSGYQLYINGAAAVGQAKSIITADYFHVRPSDILYFKAWTRSLNQTVGNAGMRVKQYDAGLNALADIPLVSYAAAQTAYENKGQDVTLAATTRFVRLELWADATYDGTFWSHATTLRKY